MELKNLDTAAELEAAYMVLRELRADLSFESFNTIYRAARTADGYTIVGLLEGERCIAVMGYRVLHDYVHGKHLYIDDLAVTESRRSGGLGAKLLHHAEKVASDLKCTGLRLCTGTANTRGIQFYEREGWALRSVVYKKSTA